MRARWRGPRGGSAPRPAPRRGAGASPTRRVGNAGSGFEIGAGGQPLLRDLGEARVGEAAAAVAALAQLVLDAGLPRFGLAFCAERTGPHMPVVVIPAHPPLQPAATARRRLLGAATSQLDQVSSIQARATIGRARRRGLDHGRDRMQMGYTSSSPTPHPGPFRRTAEAP
jgi:hypothetical protein